MRAEFSAGREVGGGFFVLEYRSKCDNSDLDA